MKTLVYAKCKALLDGFKFGVSMEITAQFTEGVDDRGFWLLIEDDRGADNQTYELCQKHGLIHTDTGVEI